MTELQQAIASGQVSEDRIEAHRAAGELPIVMYEPPIAQPVQPASEKNMPVTPTERMCEVINGGYENLSAVDKKRLMNRAKLLYSALLRVAPTSQPAQPAERQSQDALDAVRYRFLRNGNVVNLCDSDFYIGVDHIKHVGKWALQGLEADAAIDEAIAARGAT